MTKNVKIMVGLIATGLFLTFIFGLSHSISTGFAGFDGGMPFMIIAIVVCSGAVYDFWDECLRKKK